MTPTFLGLGGRGLWRTNPKAFLSSSMVLGLLEDLLDGWGDELRDRRSMLGRLAARIEAVAGRTRACWTDREYIVDMVIVFLLLW